MHQEEVAQHFELNAKDYEIHMGTADHLMMHYGDHSTYRRSLFEKVMRKMGMASRSEVEEAVVHRVAALCEKAGIDENEVVLDSGCGRGGNAIWIAKHTGAHVIGIDINESHLEEARERAEKEGVTDNTEFVQGSFDDLPVSGFDVYFAVESQCYSQDEKSLLEQVYKALNPGGRVIISDGFRIKRLTADEEQVMEDMHKGWGVDYLAHKDDFKTYMGEEGFENIGVECIQENIRPTAEYLHRISLITAPYIFLRREISRLLYKITDRVGSNREKYYKKQYDRYRQVWDLATTGRYQYIAGKQGLWTQFDFYAEKPV